MGACDRERHIGDNQFSESNANVLEMLGALSSAMPKCPYYRRLGIWRKTTGKPSARRVQPYPGFRVSPLTEVALG